MNIFVIRLPIKVKESMGFNMRIKCFIGRWQDVDFSLFATFFFRKEHPSFLICDGIKHEAFELVELDKRTSLHPSTPFKFDGGG